MTKNCVLFNFELQAFYFYHLHILLEAHKTYMYEQLLYLILIGKVSSALSSIP